MQTQQKHKLTANLVREFVSYDPATGRMTWNMRSRCWFLDDAGHLAFNRRWANMEAGSIDSHGYVAVMLLGRLYRAHRVAWLIMTGSWPSKEIDHVNGVRSDNRFLNLREASPAENRQNRCVQRNSVTGVTGVGWCNKKKKFRARIEFDGVEKHLGYFDRLEDAISARTSAKLEWHKFNGFDRQPLVRAV